MFWIRRDAIPIQKQNRDNNLSLRFTDIIKLQQNRGSSGRETRTRPSLVSVLSRIKPRPEDSNGYIVYANPRADTYIKNVFVSFYGHTHTKNLPTTMYRVSNVHNARL